MITKISLFPAGNNPQMFNYLGKNETRNDLRGDSLLTDESLVKVMLPIDKNAEVRSLEKIILSDLRKFLSSAIFSDIGPVTSKRVVSFFGINTVQVIESSIHELLKVSGVGRKRMLSIQRGWSFQKSLVEQSATLIGMESDK